MSAAERQLQTEFSNDQLDRFLFALMGRMKFHFTPDGQERPRTKEEIAEFLNCSRAQVDKLVRLDVLKKRYLYEGSDPRFFVSEIRWK